MQRCAGRVEADDVAAAARLEAWPDTSGWSNFARFNLGVVQRDGRYLLVEREVALAAREILAESVLLLAEPGAAADDDVTLGVLAPLDAAAPKPAWFEPPAQPDRVKVTAAATATAARPNFLNRTSAPFRETPAMHTPKMTAITAVLRRVCWR